MIEPTISYQGVTYEPMQSQENTPLVPVIPVTAQPIITQQKKTSNKADKIAAGIIGGFSCLGVFSGLGSLIISGIIGDGDLAIGGGVTLGISIFGLCIASCIQLTNR